jgi:alpha-N-arabinofuranosidase
MKAEKTVRVLKELPWSGNETILRLSEREHVLTFAFGETLSSLKDTGASGDARKLNVPVDGGMVGAVVGVYASASGRESRNKAAFNWTEYRNIL